MAAEHVFLFGDQADASIPMIRRLLERSRHSKNLETFLHSAIDHVQLEVAKLTPAEQDTLGSFHSVQDLTVALKNKSDRHGIAQMVVIFISRIGELILHAENDPALLSNSTPLLSLGICGGLLPAAAAAVATNVNELVEVASYIAGINCRVAAAISRRSIQVEDSTESWAFSVLGKVVGELPKILAQFHRDNLIPRHRQAYIAIGTPTWATVFGPPSVLKTLLDTSATLSKSEVTVLPAFGAVHASHLPCPDFEDLIPDSPLLNKSIKPGFKLCSGSSYAPFAASSLKDLLPPIMLDIFQNATNPARLFDMSGSYLAKGKEVSLLMLGASSYLVLLRRSLHNQGFKVSLKSGAPSPPNTELRGGSGSVAIVGMSGQFPGAANMEEMWQRLMQRDELHRKIPADRFDADEYFDESGRGPRAITASHACFLDQPGLFDHKMFNVSPREAMQMDPGQRLLMHAVYEALEESGVCNNGSVAMDSKRIGTYIGDGSDDWRELQQQHGIDKYILQGTQRSFTPGRLNHHFKWEGATFCVDSACGSTASAVGLAYRALISRDCDVAIAGGSNIIATPFWQSVLSKGGFLSTTGGCKTFRGDADGYCRGEAVGAIVLKRLEDAIHDNDNIVSVIRSYARNHSAEAVSITRPHVGTQERVYRRVLHQAGLEPNDISYVEMHGTGTTAGDSAELESVVNILGHKSVRDSPLLVGAIKANMGHSEAASGISSIMKAAMMFGKGVVPPQVGMPHKLGDFDFLKHGTVVIPGEPVPYSHQSIGNKRRMIVNNFDAAGGNSCFILEEPPLPPVREQDPRSHHIVTVSTHCSTSHEQNKRRLLEYLKANSHVSVADLSYTTTARRMHHSLRSAYSGGSVQDIIDELQRDLTQDSAKRDKTITNKPPRVAFLFTGQGAHYAGMGADLFKTSPLFRSTLMGLQRTVTTNGLPSFVQLISNPDGKNTEPTVVQTHLALVALEMALVDLWKSWGVMPNLVIGHSIGEYAALYAAGVLSATDAMYLVGMRAKLIQNSCTRGTHGMLSISTTAERLTSLLNDDSIDLASSRCEIACRNSPGMAVISAKVSDLSRIEASLKTRNVKYRVLEVPYAMHSQQMDSVLSGLREVADGVLFNAPNPDISIVSTLTGGEHSIFNADYLVRHTRESVQFEQAISHSFERGLVDDDTLWLEMGPNPVCLGLLRANKSHVASSRILPSLKQGVSDWKSITSSLASCYSAGKSIGWRAYHQDFSSNLSLINLPRYAFDVRNYWMPYTAGALAAKVGDESNQPISACLHQLVHQEDNDEEQTATFKAMISQPSLLEMIQGHKLSGITVCPAGVFSEMALTAARYLLTGGSWGAAFPTLSILDTQIDHPIMPDPKNPDQAIDVTIKRSKQANEFMVSIADHANPSVISSKCLIRVRDQDKFEIERNQLLDKIRPKIVQLQKAAAGGVANRFQGKLFYSLFGNLMGYDRRYEGVQEAIVSGDFTEALASVKLPPSHDGPNGGTGCTLSPYWIDGLTHLVGFLFNGNPMSSGDDVYIGTHMERMEIVAKDFSPNVTYQAYAYTERSEDSHAYRGHVYIMNGESIVGFLEGARFRKMPRHTLHRILGHPDIRKQTKVLSESTKPSTHGKATGTNGLNGHATNGGVTNGHVTNGHLANDYAAPAVSTNGVNSGSNKSLYSVLVDQLIEETGMEKDELTPSAYFTEIGVDSLMSISILAALKDETGVELNASFLMDYPTLEDAQRQLRMIEGQNKEPVSNEPSQTPHMNGNGNAAARLPDCNVVLMQGPPVSSASRSPLFLITDGAGSAAAYIHLPKIASDLPVYAVESPWVNDPENFTYSFEQVTRQYLAAVRAKQPHGPYMLGGWSAGGVFAYEVARLLLEAQEEVLGLMIIDITGPRSEDRSKVAAPTMEIIDQIGMLTGIDRNIDDAGPQSRRLKLHMLSTVTCFSEMDPTPMDPTRRPARTFIIWAKEDIIPKSAQEALPSGLDAWFYPASHADASPSGWDVLIGGQLEISQIEGDHFSIMTSPHVTQLGNQLRQAVEACQL
ncbi:putative polyketide synthase [Astrocystis sublimbata]|nr:putative polyketide synthase [Astrocystis sublimbata]